MSPTFNWRLEYFSFQLVIEVVAASDVISNDSDLSLGDQMQALPVSEWFGLIQRATDTLMNLVLHVKV